MSAREFRSGLVLLLFGLGLTPSVRADQDDDEKKAKEEWREAEGQQGEGQGKEGEKPGVPNLDEENPLPKIIEMMEKVEERLVEADTGDFTQEEQRRIVEAMRFEQKSSQALEDLIRQIEEQAQQQQQQSSGGDSQQQQQRQRQQQKNETPEQRAEREKREREEMERRKREEEQRQSQQMDKQQQNQQPQDQRQPRGEQERKEGQPPPDESGQGTPPGEGAGQWGRLPKKLHQDAQNARNHEAPSRWRELIEKYRIELSKEGED